MTRKAQSTIDHTNTLLIAINAPYHKDIDHESYIEEFKNLVKTYGIEYDKLETIKLREVDTSYFITKGKLEDLEKFCKENKIETVIFSEALTVKQERNLKDVLNADVTDRTRLILDIFEQGAVSAEGKAQVRIAYLEHLKSRVSGKGIEFSQQSGVVGIRGGSGETAKESELRYLNQEIRKHKKVLEKIQSSREVQRKRRLKNKEPMICLIGYTNAGKSSILNALTKSDVLAEDKLFATLDTTTRQLYINAKKIGVLSDTVGFIQQLPHRLIEAFKSTLSELQHADLLLHVVDLTDHNWQSHINIVHQILEELEVDKDILYVFNKLDLVENIDDQHGIIGQYKPHVIISTKSKEGIAPLLTYLEEWHKNNHDITLPKTRTVSCFIGI